ncbi:hypothetical protein F2P56_016621, partial [Juglans regia]
DQESYPGYCLLQRREDAVMKNSSMSHPFDSTPKTLQRERDQAGAGGSRDKGDVKSYTVEKNKEAVSKKAESKPPQDIDESAEAFIKKFRHQLLIQRLESIENYEQMLARGL